MQPRVANTPDVFLSLPITPGILWVVFLIALVLFGIVSWMFVHHWRYYGIADNNRIFIQGLYFVIGTTLFVLMGIFIGTYSFIK
jgi:hypothetical protein